MNRASFMDWLLGVLWMMVITVACVIMMALLFGCATTAPPAPIVGEVRTVEIRVPVAVSCVNESDLPKRPVTAMPAERDASRKRKVAGVAADANEFTTYADELRAAITTCIQRGGQQ